MKRLDFQRNIYKMYFQFRNRARGVMYEKEDTICHRLFT